MMNKSWLLGLFVGLLGGFVLAAAVLTSRNSAREAEKAREVLAWEADWKKSEQQGKDERKRLSDRLAELEGQLATKTAELEKQQAAKKEPPPAPAAVEAPAAKADLAGKFAALVEKGLAAYGGADFQALAKLVKESGKEAIDFLAQSLLKGAKSGERFLAAGLLEAAGDAAAIPALAEALRNDSDLLVRRMASHAIAVIGTEGAEAPLRGAMTGDKDWGVRVNSAYGLAKLGREDGLTMLRDAYTSADTPATVRVAILGGLADVAAPSTAPLFRKILSDTKDETFLFLAINALLKMKDEGSRAELERLVSSDLPETLREQARKALDQLGK